MDVKVTGTHHNGTACMVAVGECTEVAAVHMTEATIEMMKCRECEWDWDTRMVTMCEAHQVTW